MVPGTMSIPLRHLLGRRWLRWLLAALALIAVTVGVLEAAGWPFLREPLARVLQSQLQREVAIGSEFKLRLLGAVRLQTDSFVLGSPPAAPVLQRDGQPQPFIAARGMSLVLPYSTVFALLRGGDRRQTPQIRSLDVERLDLGLARASDGRANWQFGEPTTDDRKADLPEFGRLVVRDGRLRLDDAKQRLVLDATLRTLEGSTAAGSEGAGLELKGAGSFREAPLQLSLRSSGVLPLAGAAATGSAPTVPIALDLRLGKAHLVLDGHGADLLSLAVLDADTRLEAPSLAALGDAVDLSLPASAPIAFRGRLRKNGEVVNADIAELAIGSSRLKGQLMLDLQPSVPQLRGQLSGARLALPDLGIGKGKSAGSGKTAPDPTPNLLLPRGDFDPASLGKLNAELTLRLDRVDLGSPRISALAPLHARLVLRDRMLSIDDLLVRAAGGELRGSLALDARPKPVRLSSELRWSGLRMERLLLSGDGAKDGKGNKAGNGTPAISGVLGGHAKLQGSGSSTAALLGSLDGSAEAWLRDGHMSALLTEVAGIDLAESLGLALRGDEGLPIRCAAVQLALDNGVVTPTVAVLDNPDTTLYLSGRVALVDEQLDLLLRARPRDFTIVSLRSPVHVRGSFANPKISLDAGKVGLRVAAAAALAAAAAPLAALLAFADVGDPERAACSQALQRLQSPGAPQRPEAAKKKQQAASGR